MFEARSVISGRHAVFSVLCVLMMILLVVGGCGKKQAPEPETDVTETPVEETVVEEEIDGLVKSHRF